jgi:hypothetical protein
MAGAAQTLDRDLRAELNYRFGHHAVDGAPDRRPAIRLRRLLEDDRRLGLDFDSIFQEDVKLALDGIGLRGMDRAEWHLALWATREQWRAGYERTTPVICHLTADLLTDSKLP